MKVAKKLWLKRSKIGKTESRKFAQNQLFDPKNFFKHEYKRDEIREKLLFLMFFKILNRFRENRA